MHVAAPPAAASRTTPLQHRTRCPRAHHLKARISEQPAQQQRHVRAVLTQQTDPLPLQRSDLKRLPLVDDVRPDLHRRTPPGLLAAAHGAHLIPSMSIPAPRPSSGPPPAGTRTSDPPCSC